MSIKKILAWCSMTTLIVGVTFGSTTVVTAQTAEQTHSVIISEIAWAGTEVSSNDEWIELFNTTQNQIDITGWTLAWDGGNITLSGTIAAQSYFILERSDDDSLPGYTADQLYVGTLGNSGEDITLATVDGAVSDSLTMSQDNWVAGDNTTKQTMERVCPLNNTETSLMWTTSEQVGGTPAAGADNCIQTNSNTETDQNEQNNDSSDTNQSEINCSATEISRICTADGVATATYSYQNQTCDDDYTELVLDASCGCTYTAWNDSSCISETERLQTRQASAPYPYCLNTTQVTTDQQCQADTTPTAPQDYYSGNICGFGGTFHWGCSSATIILSDDYSLATLNHTQEQHMITLTSASEVFGFYWLSGILNDKQVTIFVTPRGQITAFSSGWRFRGELQE